MSEEEKKQVQKKPKSKARKIIEWVLTGLFLVLFAIVGIAQIDGMVHKGEHHGQMLKFGYGTFVVKTESMEPKYKKGDALVTQLQSFEKIYKDYQAGKDIDVTFWYDINAYNEVVASEFAVPQNNPQLTELISPATYPIITHKVMEIRINESKKAGEGRYYFIAAGINDSVASAVDPNTGKVKQYQVFTEKYLLGRVVIGSAFLGGVFSFVSSIWGLLILLLIPAFYLIITSVIDIFKAYKEPEEAVEGAGEGVEGAPSNNKEIDLSEEDKKRLKEELLQEMLSKKKGDNK